MKSQGIAQLPLVALLGFALGGSACNDSSLAPAVEATENPVAVIDGSTEFAPLDTGTFDGSASYDPDGTAIAAYAWAVVARPAGSTSALQPLGTDGAQVDFFVDLAGDYTIELTVTDEQGETGSTQFTFGAVPAQSLHVQLTWNTYGQTDNDLHLVNTGDGGSYWDSQTDCYFMNCKTGTLDWGQAGVTADNPTLDIDNISDTVPENINIITPADGQYEINVHVYSNSGGSPTTATVRVYLAGQLAYENVRTLNQTADVWRVASVNWTGGQGTISEINSVFTHPFFATPEKN